MLYYIQLLCLLLTGAVSQTFLGFDAFYNFEVFWLNQNLCGAFPWLDGGEDFFEVKFLYCKVTLSLSLFPSCLLWREVATVSLTWVGGCAPFLDGGISTETIWNASTWEIYLFSFIYRFIDLFVYLFMHHLFTSVWTLGYLCCALGYSPILGRRYFQKFPIRDCKFY